MSAGVEEHERQAGTTGHASAPSRKRWGLLAAGLVGFALVLAAYGNSLHNSFHFDDAHVIENNVYIRSLGNVPRFFVDSSTFSSLPSNASYRPLLSTTFALDHALGGGLDPLPFHRTQLVLLLALGLLLVPFYRGLVAETLGGAARWGALFGALFFCLHTANTETQNFLSCRSELLSVLGVVGSFLLWLRLPRARRTGLYLVPMLFGTLAKVHAVMFAPLLLVHVWLFPEREASARERLRAALWATWPAFVVALLAYLFVSRMDGLEWRPGSGDRLEYAWTQPFIWLHYARLFVLPLGLTADTDWKPFASWYDTRALVGDLFLVFLLLAFVRASRARKTRPVAFGLAWFAIALAPTSSFVPFSEVANEHRLFFPFVGLTLAAVASVPLLERTRLARLFSAPHVSARRRALLAVLAGALLLAHAVGTWERNQDWETERLLWKDVTEKSPLNGRGQMNYALALMRAGELEPARETFERAARLWPNYSTLEVNLGVIYAALEQGPKAEAHFRRALELVPNAEGHFFYGRWLAEVGRGPEAITHLRQAIAGSAARLDAREVLMALESAAGDDQALLALARDTLAIDPGHAQAAAYLRGETPPLPPATTPAAALATGMSALKDKHFAAAAGSFRQMVKLDPASADGWNNLGWAQFELGFLPASIASYERALAVDPDHALAKNNLALARKEP